MQPETLAPDEGVVETSVQADDRLTAAERANRIKVLQEGLSKTNLESAESSKSEDDDEEKELKEGDTVRVVVLPSKSPSLL